MVCALLEPRTTPSTPPLPDALCVCGGRYACAGVHTCITWLRQLSIPQSKYVERHLYHVYIDLLAIVFSAFRNARLEVVGLCQQTLVVYHR